MFILFHLLFLLLLLSFSLNNEKLQVYAFCVLENGFMFCSFEIKYQSGEGNENVLEEWKRERKRTYKFEYKKGETIRNKRHIRKFEAECVEWSDGIIDKNEEEKNKTFSVWFLIDFSFTCSSYVCTLPIIYGSHCIPQNRFIFFFCCFHNNTLPSLQLTLSHSEPHNANEVKWQSVERIVLLVGKNKKPMQSVYWFTQNYIYIYILIN